MAEIPAGHDRIEVYEDAGGEFRWHRTAANNERLSYGEGYESRTGAKRGAERANPGAVFPDGQDFVDVPVSEGEVPAADDEEDDLPPVAPVPLGSTREAVWPLILVVAIVFFLLGLLIGWLWGNHEPDAKADPVRSTTTTLVHDSSSTTTANDGTSGVGGTDARPVCNDHDGDGHSDTTPTDPLPALAGDCVVK